MAAEPESNLSRPLRVVIDTDAGIDDTVAIALALRSPELSVVAITTTFGNAPLAITTRNVRYLLRIMGRSDIPVIPGAGSPRARPYTPPDTHGATGVGYAPIPNVSPAAAAPNYAALSRVLRRARAPVTLITMGPLTNLSYALDQSAVHGTVATHIGMFGTLDTRGARDHMADFNAWADPEAADIVVRSGVATKAISLDASRSFSVSETAVHRLGGAPDPLSRWLAEALRYSVESHRQRFGLKGCYLPDVLTIGALLGGESVTFETARIVVDLDENDGRAHTRRAQSGTDLPFASAVDAVRMRSLLTRVFGTTWFTGKGVQG